MISIIILFLIGGYQSIKSEQCITLLAYIVDSHEMMIEDNNAWRSSWNTKS